MPAEDTELQLQNTPETQPLKIITAQFAKKALDTLGSLCATPSFWGAVSTVSVTSVKIMSHIQGLFSH